MNYYDYLKDKFPLYIASGVVFALALCALITMHRYNEHLWDVLNNMHNMSINAYKMNRQLRDLEAAKEHFRARYGADLPGSRSETVLLRALDSLRAEMPRASIAVREIKKTGEGAQLPLEVEAPMKSYAMVVDSVTYLESFRMPDFRISHMRLFYDSEEGVILRVNGFFMVPSVGAEA